MSVTGPQPPVKYQPLLISNAPMPSGRRKTFPCQKNHYRWHDPITDYEDMVHSGIDDHLNADVSDEPFFG